MPPFTLTRLCISLARRSYGLYRKVVHEKSPGRLPSADKMHLLAVICTLSQQSANLTRQELTVGRTVIPTLARRWDSNEDFRAARAELFAAGLYPGVDYIIEGNDEAEGLVTLRPAYPLVKKLERDDWPVSVPFELAPRWTTPTVYNAFTAAFAVGLALTWLLFGFALSTVLTLSKIPSASMAPSILPNDVLLVEKLTPRLPFMALHADDVSAIA